MEVSGQLHAPTVSPSEKEPNSKMNINEVERQDVDRFYFSQNGTPWTLQ
jgi:hypothetical protein